MKPCPRRRCADIPCQPSPACASGNHCYETTADAFTLVRDAKWPDAKPTVFTADEWRVIEQGGTTVPRIYCLPPEAPEGTTVTASDGRAWKRVGDVWRLKGHPISWEWGELLAQWEPLTSSEPT